MAIDVREWAVTAPSPDTNIVSLSLHLAFRPFTSRAHTVATPSSGYTLLELPSPSVPSNLVALALEPMDLTLEEAEDMREFLAHSTAYPTLPLRNIPEGDRSLLIRRSE